MNNKKILALILAFAMMFSSITTVFADTTATIGADAEALKTIGVLKGDSSVTGVTPEYLAKATTRMQAAIMYLRLNGLEEEALAFTGTANFTDVDTMAWGQGKAVMAYLKANPQLGWIGDAGKFNPNATATAAEYYKVMLEALGYKQTTAEVVGDYTWKEVMTFAASKGLVKLADNANFTNNDLAIATIEGLKTIVKGTETTLAAKMVDAGMINEAAAVAAGLYEAVVAFTAVVDEATALGNAVVEVQFEDDVDAAAGNVANYAIEGLVINSAIVTGSDTVRLETEAMTSGKLYKLTVGEKTVQFTGIAKVTGGPEIDTVISEDVEEVVIDFNKNIDYVTGTDVANYSITGVTIVKAEVDGDEVTLTTEGLKNKTKYTVKATGIESVDGTAKRSNSESFTTKLDTNAPKIDGEVEVQTNERIVVKFSEKVTKESAENLANYSIKVDETNGSELDIISVTWDNDDKNNVEIVTEPMEKREDYKLSINNIADQRKVANVMTRPATKVFEAIAQDESAPTWKTITVLSPTTILVEFADGSKIDEASALDTNNYSLEDLEIESIATIKNEWKTFRAILTVEEMETGDSYDLTIIDVLDEFGNAMKETTKSAKAVAGNLASAKLLTAVATDKNAITLTFDKEVDEATAENLANYTVDEEVGAPTKATLQDDGVTVKLEVNDIVNGYGEYDVIVDGVEDLAGNDLYFKMKVDTATNNWDTTAPELEDADVVSSNVVALSFDEMVAYEIGAKLVLAVDGVDNDATNITLAAKGYADEDTVVEFSTNTALDVNKNYTVVGVVYGDTNVDGGVKDLYGNRVLETTIAFGDFSFEGTADVQEAVEVDSYEQVNGKAFEVAMTKFVDFTGEDAADVEGFTVSIDEDVVTFTKNEGKIEEDEDYTFNFAAILADKHGFAAENADTTTTTVLTGEYTDEDAPEVESVVAVDRYTIEITFSEDMPVVAADDIDTFVAAFGLKNYDLDNTIVLDNTVLGDNDGDNVIKITLAKPMEARYEYELTLGKEKVADYVGLKNEDEATFYFDGTNLAK